MVYAEVADIIAAHRERDRAVVLLSASGEEMVAPIAEMVGADDFVASRMAVAEGRYTGQIEFYCYGEWKADAARDIARERGLDLAACYAYSDSITDLPLLETRGAPGRGQPGPGAAPRGGPSRLAGAELRAPGPAAHQVALHPGRTHRGGCGAVRRGAGRGAGRHQPARTPPPGGRRH